MKIDNNRQKRNRWTMMSLNLQKLFPEKKLNNIVDSQCNNNNNNNDGNRINNRVRINFESKFLRLHSNLTKTIQQQEHFTINDELIIVLRDNNNNNAIVYLIGTNHINPNSVIAVDLLIKRVQPHVVVTELDKSRTGLNKNSKVFSGRSYVYNYKLLRDACDEFDFIGGMIFFMLAYFETFVGRMFNVNWGADLRSPFLVIKGNDSAIDMMPRDRADSETARSYEIMLGDRPIEITFKRMALALSNVQKSYIVFASFLAVCFSMKCTCLKTATRLNRHPNFESVLVHERDVYLTYSLQRAAKMKFDNAKEPTRVVGIVGMDHVPGIVKLWGTVTDRDLQTVTAT